MTEPSSLPTRDEPRGPLALALLALLGLVLFAGFIALGTWQVHRLAWKRALIAHVDARVRAPPEDAPGPAQWPRVTAAADEYRHVWLHGRFLYDRSTYVWAATAEGSGLWVMTPLRRDDGSLVLVNRGFVTPEWCGRRGTCAPGAAGPVTVTGLLRISEPPGFLRHNTPAKDDWYTRDVAAIAARRGLHDVAPYFVDEDAASEAGVENAPKGGLTVIRFPNNHLSYLITWYAMALMVLVAGCLVGRSEWRRRRARPASGAAGKRR
ncbi:MAG TPA: SURF1 family protein [Dyella sp.]|nr:SURF1 family protein [Dyella sp.]